MGCAYLIGSRKPLKLKTETRQNSGIKDSLTLSPQHFGKHCFVRIETVVVVVVMWDLGMREDKEETEAEEWALRIA